MDAPLEALYTQARDANREVADTLAAYEKATRARAEVIRALRDAGQPIRVIATMLDLSPSRVAQLVGDGPKRRVEDQA